MKRLFSSLNYYHGMIIINDNGSRKDEQIAELQRKCDDFQNLVNQLQESKKSLLTEKATLLKKIDTAQSHQKKAEQRAMEARAQRPSIREETGITLENMQLSEAAVQAKLLKHGINMVDLYVRVLKLEDARTQAVKEKEEAEL